MTDESPRPPADRRPDDDRSPRGDGSDDGPTPSHDASDGPSRPDRDGGTAPGSPDEIEADPPPPTHPKTAALATSETEPEGTPSDGGAGGGAAVAAGAGGAVQVSQEDEVPPDVRRYDRFQKVDKASYERVNDFLRERTYITAREWAIARLCADFRTATGVEMTKIGEHLPELVPFMTDTYSPQAVNQARSAFEEKVRMAGATFLYGAMSGFFTADELDDLMYEVTEVAKFLLEVEGVELAVEEELEAEERISSVMREVRRASEGLRYEGVECPECSHEFTVETSN